MPIPVESGAGKPHPMAEFFDERAGIYDDHMRGLGPDMAEFYRLVSVPVTPTNAEIAVLDLGIGTGLELAGLFTRVPRARVAGIDLSPGMLSELRRKHHDRLGQIDLRLGSFFDTPFAERGYDYVLSVMSMHHLPCKRRSALYTKIRAALKPGGMYIEGDYIVSLEQELEMLAEYDKAYADHGLAADGLYHIDIPFCLATQVGLLREAGFAGVEVVWEGERKGILSAGPGA